MQKKSKISNHFIPYKRKQIKLKMLSKQIEIPFFVTVFLSIPNTINYPAQHTFKLNLKKKITKPSGNLDEMKFFEQIHSHWQSPLNSSLLLSFFSKLFLQGLAKGFD